MAKIRDIPVRHPIKIANTFGGCPICGEKRTTQDVYGDIYTYLCGYSGGPGDASLTSCQGKHFEQFLPGGAGVEASIWEGVW